MSEATTPDEMSLEMTDLKDAVLRELISTIRTRPTQHYVGRQYLLTHLMGSAWVLKVWNGEKYEGCLIIHDITAPQQQIPGTLTSTAPRGGEPASAAGAEIEVLGNSTLHKYPMPGPANQGGEGRVAGPVTEFDLLLSSERAAHERIAGLERKLKEANRERADAEAKAIAERDMWKANHDEMVKRNAVLRARPDLPADRLPAIERLVKERDDAYRAGAEAMREACITVAEDWLTDVTPYVDHVVKAIHALPLPGETSVDENPAAK